jgi:hypothetical protein
LRRVWRPVPRSCLAVSRLPTVSSLAAVSAVTGKALGAIGSLAWRGSWAAITPSSTVSTAIAIVEIGSAIAGRFSRTIDCR